MKSTSARPPRRFPAHSELRLRIERIAMVISSPRSRDIVGLAAAHAPLARVPPAQPAPHVPSAKPGPRMPSARRGKPVILFLAANPHHSKPLRIPAECSALQRELRQARYRSDFRFESRWAVTIEDLMRHITELEPTVLHISSHGAGSAGLILEDDHGGPRMVSARALALMIAATTRHISVVVINACYSIVQAEALRNVVDCVVGMDGAIGEAAAHAFASRFYAAIAARRSIGNAVAQAIAALAAYDLPDEMLPRCVAREDIAVDELFLPTPGRPQRIRKPRRARARGGQAKTA